MSQSNSPYSVLNALMDYEVQVRMTMPQKKADATLAQVRTALWRYTLPAWELPLPQGQRLTQEEYERGLHFLKQLPLERLKDALEVQERLFEQLDVAGNSRRNYRWALKTFIDWCYQQSWFETQLETKVQRSVSRKRQRKLSANDVRLTTRKAKQAYRLAETERSESLQQELKVFFQSLTGTGLNDQDRKPVTPQTAEQYLNQVLRILGWLHMDQKIPSQELSLRQLVEIHPSFIGREQNDLSSQANAERLVELAQAYLQWLKAPKRKNWDEGSEAVQNPYTDIKVINIWLTVARYIYGQSRMAPGKEVEHARAAISALEELRKRVTSNLKVHQSMADESKQRLEWHEFLDLVEKLRGECIPRFHQSTQSKQRGTTLSPPRTLTAIAQSYQRFLLVAFFAYIPPQRPHVLRNLVIAPASIPKQPLHSQELFSEDSILYQDQNTWWIQMLAGGKNHQHKLVRVPNLSYPDGRYFYQYLEEWLLHYVHKDRRSKAVEVPGLRSCFKPHHSRLFTMKNGQPYQDSAAFIALLRHPTYRLSGKAINPHMLRNIYSTHLIDEESSGLELDNRIGEFAITRTKEDEYNSVDWQKAAEIAQAFLNRMFKV